MEREINLLFLRLLMVRLAKAAIRRRQKRTRSNFAERKQVQRGQKAEDEKIKRNKKANGNWKDIAPLPLTPIHPYPAEGSV